MVIDWTLVYDNGDRPFAPDLPVEQRRPLVIRANETTTINVRLVTPFGAPYELVGTTTKLVLTARSTPVPSTKLLFAKDSTARPGPGLFKFVIAATDTRSIRPQFAGFDVVAIEDASRVVVVPLSELSIGRSGVLS